MNICSLGGSCFSMIMSFLDLLIGPVVGPVVAVKVVFTALIGNWGVSSPTWESIFEFDVMRIWPI